MKTAVVIPARIGSSRLSQKVILPLGNYPIVVHICKRAKEISLADSVIVATDSEIVVNICKEHDIDCVLTDPELPSGTDRVYEAIKNKNFDVIVNIQGDEPFFPIALIDDLIKMFLDKKITTVGTLAAWINDEETYKDPSCVKVIIDKNSFAINFTRAPSPFFRDTSFIAGEALKHIGVYIYTMDALEQFVKLKGTSKLEHFEKLEQLRLVEQRVPIYVKTGNFFSLGIDTQKDYDEALKLFKE